MWYPCHFPAVPKGQVILPLSHSLPAHYAKEVDKKGFPTPQHSRGRVACPRLFGLILAFATVFALQHFVGPAGVRKPFLDRRIAAYILLLIFSPIIHIPLYALNRHVLKWRLGRGRDILEEEKYETESGFISLKPRDNEDDKGWRIRGRW